MVETVTADNPPSKVRTIPNRDVPSRDVPASRTAPAGRAVATDRTVSAARDVATNRTVPAARDVNTSRPTAQTRNVNTDRTISATRDINTNRPTAPARIIDIQRPTPPARQTSGSRYNYIDNSNYYNYATRPPHSHGADYQSRPTINYYSSSPRTFHSSVFNPPIYNSPSFYNQRSNDRTPYGSDYSFGEAMDAAINEKSVPADVARDFQQKLWQDMNGQGNPEAYFTREALADFDRGDTSVGKDNRDFNGVFQRGRNGYMGMRDEALAYEDMMATSDALPPPPPAKRKSNPLEQIVKTIGKVASVALRTGII
jgi:hypothetical protein